MAKKKTRFEVVDGTYVPDRPPRPSHSERVAVGQRATDIVLQLIERRDLTALPIEDAVRDAVIEARSISSKPARDRQIRLVGRLLRGADFDAIEAALADRHHTARPPTEAERWVARIVESDDAIEAFVSSHPHADRQQLRTLARKLRKAAPEQTGRLEKQLRRLLSPG